MGTLIDNNKGLYTVDYGNYSNKFAIAGASGLIWILSLNNLWNFKYFFYFYCLNENNFFVDIYTFNLINAFIYYPQYIIILKYLEL